MEYTAKDQLAQWEEGDWILREDFNRDNARTEAALADMLHRCAAIKSVSLGSTPRAPPWICRTATGASGA